MQPTPTRAFPAPAHDHRHCVADLMTRAEAAFLGRGLRLTGLRQKVLAEIAASHHAVGAYDILASIARRDGKRLAPVSVYRAIDALLATGLVHRLESRNAFFACSAPHERERQQLILACQTCGGVAEVAADPVFAAIDRAACGAAFVGTSALVEILGVCGHCGEGAAASVPAASSAAASPPAASS